MKFPKRLIVRPVKEGERTAAYLTPEDADFDLNCTSNLELVHTVAVYEFVKTIKIKRKVEVVG